MNVGIILSQSLGETGSGIFTLNAAAGLLMEGHRVHILAVEAEGARKSPVPTGSHIRISYLSFPTKDKHGPHYYVPGMSDVMPYPSTAFKELSTGQIQQYIDYWTRSLRAFLSDDLDLIHVNHWWIVAALALRLTKLPIVVTLHGTDLEQWQLAPDIVDFAGLRDLKPARFHAVSHNVKQKAAAAKIRGSEAAVIIPPPYRDDIFQSPQLEHCREPLEAAFIGKLSERKGLGYALRALAMVRSRGVAATLTVVGDSPGGASQWDRMVAELGLGQCVTFLGQLTQAQVADVLCRVGMLIMASEDEGFGLVAVEAAACGAIVVMPEYGGADQTLSRIVDSHRLRVVPRLNTHSVEGVSTFVRNLADAWMQATLCCLDIEGGRRNSLDVEQIPGFLGLRAVANSIVREVYGNK